MKALGRDAFEERIRQAENSFFFEIRVLEGQFNLSDPEEKTKFHREIAGKLCEFTEEMERDNYLQAVADKYFIGVENLRKLVTAYASRSGLARPVERPKSGVHKKGSPEDKAKRAQQMLISWLAEEPGLYEKVKKYLSPQDFTVDLYRAVAEKLFQSLEQGTMNPAGMISTFESEEDQREIAALFSVSLPSVETGAEKGKAFRDILLSVKQNSYAYHTAHMGTDMSALAQAIEGRKALEELAKTHISLD